MPRFPANRTPVPPQRNVIVATIGITLIVVLAILCVRFEFRDESDREPIRQEYYFKAQNDETWVEKLVGDPIALFTLVLTGATIGLYLATHRLWDATERLVQGADDTARRQLRAYMSADVTNLVVKNGNIEGICTLKNCGKTPAYKATTSGGIFVGSYPLEKEDRPAEPSNGIHSEGVVGPGISVHMRAPLNVLTQEEIIAINAGRAAIYLFGSITYVDAFGFNRWTHFCFCKFAPIENGPMSAYRKLNEAN